MGLSMSYDIVTQGYGGTLAVEDTQGEGATFVVTLPRAAPQAPGGD
jgi:signal transduction histidine kinase